MPKFIVEVHDMVRVVYEVEAASAEEAAEIYGMTEPVLTESMGNDNVTSVDEVEE